MNLKTGFGALAKGRLKPVFYCLYSNGAATAGLMFQHTGLHIERT